MPLPIDPMPPVAGFALPWDDAGAPDPVAALGDARARLGDTFAVASGADTYLFVFAPAALRAFYAVPERQASKGLADYQMLVRKMPDELFAGPRTFAHDLFGAQEVEGYLGHLDHALDLELAALGDAGTLDAFAFARRVGHRLGLACWIGDEAAESPWFERLVADLDQLDGAEAFVHPERMTGVGSDDRRSERAALARFETTVGELLARRPPEGFVCEILSRWSDVDEPERTQGVARDIALLHTATMTNLFAALGWTLAQLVLDPDLARRAAADRALLERCTLESIRLGQRSVMLRSVLREFTFDDGATNYRLSAGVKLATMLPLTNTMAAPGLDTYDPDRWSGRRLRDELVAAEMVTTFGHGPHRCPAQRFSMSAIVRTVGRLLAAYDLTPEFAAVTPLAGQIGGVGRAAAPCPIAYTGRALSAAPGT